MEHSERRSDTVLHELAVNKISMNNAKQLLPMPGNRLMTAPEVQMKTMTSWKDVRRIRSRSLRLHPGLFAEMIDIPIVFPLHTGERSLQGMGISALASTIKSDVLSKLESLIPNPTVQTKQRYSSTASLNMNTVGMVTENNFTKTA